jgi:hypothetical protein
VAAGREFLQAEALQQYEERRASAAKAAKAPAAEPAPVPADEGAAGEAAPPADGMMAGVVPGVKPAGNEQAKMRPVTTFGRYVKILLSSNEFLFVS